MQGSSARWPSSLHAKALNSLAHTGSGERLKRCRPRRSKALTCLARLGSGGVTSTTVHAAGSGAPHRCCRQRPPPKRSSLGKCWLEQCHKHCCPRPGSGTDSRYRPRRQQRHFPALLIPGSSVRLVRRRQRPPALVYDQAARQPAAVASLTGAGSCCHLTAPA
jgi:hypothetical protein